MKNKGLIAFIFIFTVLVGGAFLVGNSSTAQAYDGYFGSYDNGYDDYGYGDSYDNYYDDYGYGYDNGCDYGCGGYDDYGYGYDYGYDDYGYGYDSGCDYGCGGYNYDYPEYDDCYYGYCDNYDECDYGCGGTYVPPAQPININNSNSNTNNSVNNNNNNNVNNIVIRNMVGGYSEPTYDREIVRERRDEPLVCTPASQSAGVNQSVSLRVSGGNGSYSWNAPGSQNLNGRGDSVSLRYPTSGLKTITVSSAGQTATCFVQVTGGQVLAEFIELPNTGAGGIHALMPNLLAIGGAILAAVAALVFFVRRAVIA